MADREHPAMKEVQPPKPHAAPDRCVAQPEVEQLGSRDDTVLMARKSRDLRIRGE